ncbi:DUF2130 domain-containing protein [Jejudonia soesokkakensis]|uniref:DUF2130 domain-containing protein n=1 Tax=Jejudonia soesokkakensis TaxID=1323432 RepID=A0ABW2MTU2_9FLAO
MNEIICPNCDKAFKVDEAGFADIVKQVRDNQFEEELNKRLTIAEQQKQSAVELAIEKTKSSLQEQLSRKENEITQLKANSKSELIEKLAEKDNELSDLKSKVENFETVKELAVSKATKEIEKQRDNLENDIKTKELEKENLKNSLEQKYTTELQNKDTIIKYKDDEIARVKDMKLKLSTKMMGESLEQHCEIEFNNLRSSAFQNSYFEKDNDASSGTKGDFIFKETDDQENEIVSIMFEMKNENDETTNKKKNEDFLAKLDKDRNSKNCEYAVLVSLLESDSEYYNKGIVDVSHKFPKMYVVRPQFFIPIITLLRNGAMASLKYKQELNTIRNQSIDITNFEDKINQFKDGFAKNYLSASSHFEKAIAEIDKSIARMQKVKQELTTSENQLRLANKKADGLTIKKLTYGNPTMKSKFDDLKKKLE